MSTSDPLAAVRALFGPELEQLTGAHIAGEVPLTGDVLDALVAQKLGAGKGPVVSARVQPKDAGHFVIDLGLKGPISSVKVAASIDHQPQLPADGRIGVRWSLTGFGAIAMFAAPFITKLVPALPPGVQLDGDRIWLDLPTMARAQGYGELLPLLTGLRVTTRDGQVVVQFELRR